MLSVRANSACPDEATVQRAVNEVRESCFSDVRPFDEVDFLSHGPTMSETHASIDILEERIAVQLYPHS
jgi:hypothetical protein